MAAAPFRLNPAFDADYWATCFTATGRIHIPDFLVPEDAERLLLHLKGSDEWKLVVNQGDKLFELDRAAQQSLDDAGRASLERAVHAAARHEFQFMFETIRVPDEPEARRARGDLLSAFAAFLSSAEVVELLRTVTGQCAIEFADAQATAYGLGHFLTVHDDDVAGKKRLAAYVFNLTPSWRADWGGLLLFHRPDGHVAEALTPSFNALNLFSVPQPHSVSMVAPFAPYRRYSVTGWLRSR
jgi:Rps23 Pro-64 3,4-dihydroxylase Tpa1-like proline 4-hydroxylase